MKPWRVFALITLWRNFRSVLHGPLGLPYLVGSVAAMTLFFVLMTVIIHQRQSYKEGRYSIRWVKKQKHLVTRTPVPPVTHMEIQSVYSRMIVTVNIIVKYMGYIRVFIWPCSGHNSTVVLLPHKIGREAIFATGSFWHKLELTAPLTAPWHTKL